MLVSLSYDLYFWQRYENSPIFFSGDTNCDRGVSNIPNVFTPTIHDATREAIKSIIKANSGPVEVLDDQTCDGEDQHRCPLGKCLSTEQICNGIPDCEDNSDENYELCEKKIRMCEQVNATHCQCLLDDMMCDNLMCLHSSKFCDGVNDCGDNSDEPPNCEHDCSMALQAYNQSLICDGRVDCLDEHDMGNDEAAEKCCSGEDNNYRCVLGDKPQNMEITDECISRDCVCDWDRNSTCPKCTNGADEQDCISIFGHKKHEYNHYIGMAVPTNPTLGKI